MSAAPEQVGCGPRRPHISGLVREHKKYTWDAMGRACEWLKSAELQMVCRGGGRATASGRRTHPLEDVCLPNGGGQGVRLLVAATLP